MLMNTAQILNIEDYWTLNSVFADSIAYLVLPDKKFFPDCHPCQKGHKGHMPSYMQNIVEDSPETAFLDRIVAFLISPWKQAFHSTDLGSIGFGALPQLQDQLTLMCLMTQSSSCCQCSRLPFMSGKT